MGTGFSKAICCDSEEQENNEQNKKDGNNPPNSSSTKYQSEAGLSAASEEQENNKLNEQDKDSKGADLANKKASDADLKRSEAGINQIKSEENPPIISSNPKKEQSNMEMIPGVQFATSKSQIQLHSPSGENQNITSGSNSEVSICDIKLFVEGDYFPSHATNQNLPHNPPSELLNPKASNDEEFTEGHEFRENPNLLPNAVPVNELNRTFSNESTSLNHPLLDLPPPRNREDEDKSDSVNKVIIRKRLGKDLSPGYVSIEDLPSTDNVGNPTLQIPDHHREGGGKKH